MRVLLAGWLLLLFTVARAQRVQTIVPRGPVVTGTAFQVQYIITEPGEVQQVSPPAFEGFKLVSGPNRYEGNASIEGRLQPILNITFTLVPSEAGTQRIEGLNVRFRNGSEQAGPAAELLVSPPPRASFSARSNATDLSRPAPPTAEEREAWIREHLFIRATADRKTCYVGEPILATFKLYSSLQSSSILERAPGLYGFSVVDVLDINRSHQSVETIGGQVFNTYILRKVQLYPGQSGQLLIDEMIVQNEIELPDSGGVHLLKRQLKTEPIAINVLPLPEPPADYGAAVGRFDVVARFERPNMAANEQNRLLLGIRGRGNFIQLSAPRISWPPGIDVFEPEIVDSLHYDSASASGLRWYRFAFAPSDTGWIELPPVVFPFFDPITRSYRRDSTAPMRVYVGAARKPASVARPAGRNHTYLWLGITGLLLLVAWMLGRRKKKPKPPAAAPAPLDYDAVAELQALDLDVLSGREACTQMRRIFLRARREASLSDAQLKAIQAIDEECGMIAFTGADSPGRVAALRMQALSVLQNKG